MWASSFDPVECTGTCMRIYYAQCSKSKCCNDECKARKEPEAFKMSMRKPNRLVMRHLDNLSFTFKYKDADKNEECGCSDKKFLLQEAIDH